jgi:hypothetical protein
MKKIILSMLAIAFVASAALADGTIPVKTKSKAKVKQATSIKCLKTEKCTRKCTDKNTCDKKDACCK